MKTVLEDDYDIRAVQELRGHNDMKTPGIYTHVLNRGGKGVRSPMDGLWTGLMIIWRVRLTNIAV